MNSTPGEKGMSVGSIELRKKKLAELQKNTGPFFVENKDKYPYLADLMKSLLHDLFEKHSSVQRRENFKKFIKANKGAETELNDLLQQLAIVSKDNVLGKVCDLWRLELFNHNEWCVHPEGFPFLDLTFWREHSLTADAEAVRRHFGHETEEDRIREQRRVDLKRERDMGEMKDRVRHVIDEFFEHAITKRQKFNGLEEADEALRMKIARDLKIGVIGPPGKTEEKPEELIRRLYIGGEIKSVAVYFTVRDDKVKISCVLWQLVEEGSVVGERDKAVRGLFRQKLEKYFDSAGQISPQGMEDFKREFSFSDHGYLVRTLRNIQRDVGDTVKGKSIGGLIDFLSKK